MHTTPAPTRVVSDILVCVANERRHHAAILSDDGESVFILADLSERQLVCDFIGLANFQRALHGQRGLLKVAATESSSLDRIFAAARKNAAGTAWFALVWDRAVNWIEFTSRVDPATASKRVRPFRSDLERAVGFAFHGRAAVAHALELCRVAGVIVGDWGLDCADFRRSHRTRRAAARPRRLRQTAPLALVA